jgi:hypothetical protein
MFLAFLRPQETSTTVVILLETSADKTAFFRQIDVIADLLAERLNDSERIAGMYEFVRDALVELAY